MPVDEAAIAPRKLEGPSTASAWVIVIVLFFMAGVLTTFKDVLVAHLKIVFDLNYAQAMEIPFAFFGACLVFSLPAGRLLDRIGYRRTMVAGLLLTASGSLLLFPAADVPSFPLFLTALVVQGTGMTILQVSANPFTAKLGSEETAASRLNLVQAFNSVGTAIGPKVGGVLILSGAPLAAVLLRQMNAANLHAYQLHEAAAVKLPYMICVLILIVLAIATGSVRAFGPEIQRDRESARRSDAWQHRHLVLGAIAIFVYVGAEVSIGSFLVNYLSQPEIGNISERSAAGFVSFYWGGAMVGRFIGSAAQRAIAPRSVLAFNAVMAALLVGVSMLSLGHIAMWTMIGVGLFNSIMFPTIFTLGIEGLGAFTATASGILIAATAGGAIVPELQGVIADRLGVHHSFLLPILCYAYICYFALRGSRRA